MAARTFRKKKQQQSRVFFGVIFYVYTLTWITEKERELERVIENKGDEFRRKKNMEIQSGGEKMRNASGHQGEKERQWKIKANLNTGNKMSGIKAHIWWGKFLLFCVPRAWKQKKPTPLDRGPPLNVNRPLDLLVEAIFIVVRLALHDLIFFCLHVLLTRASLLALAKSIYYMDRE